VLLGFHTKQLSERGTERAIFDYASVLEARHGIQPRIFVPASAQEIVPAVHSQFSRRFEVVLYGHPRDIVCDALYVIKRGRRSRVTERIPELNHAMFDPHEPHGERFATISHWLSSQSRRLVKLPRGRTVALPRLAKPPYVPHIVELPNLEDDLRAELAIPNEAVVFGRHGAFRSFSIPWVKSVVEEALAKRSELQFLFLNTERFIDHPRVGFLELTLDRQRIRAFINSCDYMIHARREGESFGIAVTEFALSGVPILSFSGTQRDRAHFEHVPPSLMVAYGGPDELMAKLLTLPRRPPTPAAGAVVSERFSSATVAEEFFHVFLS
jgi:hypothetical protein